jgi:hypothetical protein
LLHATDLLKVECEGLNLLNDREECNLLPTQTLFYGYPAPVIAYDNAVLDKTMVLTLNVIEMTGKRKV